MLRSYGTLRGLPGAELQAVESTGRIPDDGLRLSDFFANPRAAAAPRQEPDSPASSSSPGLSYFVETYGCQMNVNDSDIVQTVLDRAGYRRAPSADASDVLLLNTCAIRENAESKIWQRLGYLRNMRRGQLRGRRRGPVVGVLGCMAERLKGKLLEGKMASLVVGPDAYRDLPRLLEVVLPGPGHRQDAEQAINVQLSSEETYADITPVRQASDTSVFISIMRGCNQNCSYCIVPRTRGRERSRPVWSIIDEVRYLADVGTKEVWLLGQNVNSYAYFEDRLSRPTKADASRDYFGDYYAKGFSSVYKPLRDGSTTFVGTDLDRRALSLSHSLAHSLTRSLARPNSSIGSPRRPGPRCACATRVRTRRTSATTCCRPSGNTTTSASRSTCLPSTAILGSSRG